MAMLKWARRIFVFLLLGAILNVAVAWGCVAAGRRARRTYVVYRNPRNGEVPVLGVEATFGFEIACGINDWWMLYATDDGSDQPAAYLGRAWWPERGVEYGFSTHAAAGWPMLSLRECVSNFPNPLVPVADLNSGVATPPASSPVEVVSDRIGIPALLSLRPIVPGFVIDTLLYSGAIVIVLLGGSTLQQLVRRRRSLCAHCGYPRGTSPVCTECGEALPGVGPVHS